MKQLILLLLIATTLLGNKITGFSFEGNRRTQETTILRIANVVKGDTITDSLLAVASERLMKTDLFVSAEVTAKESDTVHITLNEKWTIIPYVNGLFSNSQLSVRAGIYDINMLGRNFILGGEYHYFDRTHNGMFFAGKDKIGSHNLKLRGNMRFSKGINKWYDSDHKLHAGFIADRKLGSISAELPLKRENLYIGTAAILFHDTLMERMSLIDYTSLNDSSGYSFSGENTGFSLGISSRYSGFKYNSFTYEGWGVKAGISHTFQNRYRDYNTFSASAQWYKLLPLETNLCLNAKAIVTDGHGEMSYIYIGGGNSVRGYNPGDFKGRAYLNLNSELRIPSLNTKWIVIQHIFFMDYAAFAERPSMLDDTQSLFGTGLGIRILSPKIYSFMFRFDYGWSWGPIPSRQFYLGTSHSFLPF